ncbi:MAG: hypothetical protein QF886_12785 [Planctomycetota bacterium]|nr:hypothetical protein [Planctomycetota bacterium]
MKTGKNTLSSRSRLVRRPKNTVGTDGAWIQSKPKQNLPRDLGDVFRQLSERRVLHVVLPSGLFGGDTRERARIEVNILMHPSHVEELDRILGESQAGLSNQRQLLIRRQEGHAERAHINVFTPGDGYLPESFAYQLITRRLQVGGMFMLAPNDSLLLMLYQVVFHHGLLTRDAFQEIKQLLPGITLDFNLSRATHLGYCCEVLQANGIDVSVRSDSPIHPDMPWEFPPQTVLESKVLHMEEGQNYQGRVYQIEENGRKRIFKQTLGDLENREAHFLSKLDSDLFPRLLQARQEKNYSLIELEFVDGYQLGIQGRFCREHGPEQAMSFLQDCVSILEILDAQGITHRDIHGRNILVRRGRPVLLDFGWAVSREMPQGMPSTKGWSNFPPDREFCDIYSMGVALNGLAKAFPQLRPFVTAMTEAKKADRSDLNSLRKMLQESH